MTTENEEHRVGWPLTDIELSNLQWAKDFMKSFEDKEGKRAETNRNRQNKYF